MAKLAAARRRRGRAELDEVETGDFDVKCNSKAVILLSQP